MLNIENYWDTIFKKLLKYYFTLNVLIILFYSFLLLQFFNFLFILFSIPVFLLLTNVVFCICFFHTDFVLAKMIGYDKTQSFLWEHWNKEPVPKKLRVLKPVGYDCRIGQLKYLYDRRKKEK